MTPAKPQPAIHVDRTGAIQARPRERQDPIQRAVGQGQQFLAGDHRHRATVSKRLVHRRSSIPSRIFSRGRHIIYMVFVQQHRVLPSLPAHLQSALLQPTDHPSNRHRFVAIHRLHKLSQNCQHALYEANCGLNNPSAILDQPQAQIRHTRRRQGDGQHRANHQINQQRHYQPCSHLRDLARRQCVQPDQRGAHQKKQRRLITGQQHRVFHDFGCIAGDLRQLGCLGSQVLCVLQRVFKDRLHQLYAVPHITDRRPTARQHAAANCTGRGLLPMGLEVLPLIAQPLLQICCQPGIRGKQGIHLLR
ncbi:hypothetical protein [Pseudomonas sp. 37 R 15]|nr:hypothetical protein [Pseudomonas sp. 37 R 15]